MNKLVVLTPEGFYDYSSAIATKDKLILWDQVKAIENVTIANQSFFSVYLKEPKTFLSKLSKLQRKAINENVFWGNQYNLQSAKKCTTIS